MTGMQPTIESNIGFLGSHLVAGPTPSAPREPVRLLSSYCDRCHRSEFPRRTRCVTCGGMVTDRLLAEECTLVGFTRVIHASPGALKEPPYHVGLAAFDPDRITIIGLLELPGAVEPWFGMSLRTVCVPVARDVMTYGFTLAVS